MMKVLRMGLASIGLALLATAALAANPIEITADQFVVDEASNRATFTGQVVVTRGSMTVWAARVEVDYGANGPSDIRSFEAIGDVRIRTPEQDASGDRAIYDPRAETLRLTGNVTVVNASSRVAGPDLVIDLNANTTTFSGGSNGRVTGVFTPQ